MKRDKINVIYLGYSSSMYGSASGEKAKLIGKAIVNEGATFTILSRSWRNVNYKNLKRKLLNEGITYISAARVYFRPNNFIKRNLLKLVVSYMEIKVLLALSRSNHLSIAILVSRNFSSIIYYKIVSLLFRFSLVINYMEYNSAMVTRKSRISKINDFFYERFTFKIVDAALPISEFLAQFIHKSNKKLPLLKTPVLVDLEIFDKNIGKNCNNYFLFCGAAAFIEVIRFIIKSYELVNNQEVKLQIISFGSESAIKALKSEIAHSIKADLIELQSGLEYNELIRYYKGAIALLIPLRPTLQDIARFPHKIGEYAASGRPIISNNFGEMKFYFEDEKSALLAEKYTHDDFANKMNYVINFPEKATEIGRNGRIIAETYFDYKKFGEQLVSFLRKIVK